MKNIFIQNYQIGPGSPCFIIAEVAQAHDGSLGGAHAYIAAAAKAGANAVKFQTHIASAESTIEERFRVNFSRQDKTRYDYWKRMEFKKEQWAGLAEDARSRGLVFLSSPFSECAVDLLEEIGCPAWKIGSGEIFSAPMIEKLVTTNKPVLISSGLASWLELDNVVSPIKHAGIPHAVFQCTSIYPCPPEAWGLNIFSELRSRYQCPVGFSDHSGEISAGIAAVAMGINLLEVHVTFSKDCFGPDVSSSLTFQQLSELIKGIRLVERALLQPVDKDYFAIQLKESRLQFQKGTVARRDLSAGHVLTIDDLSFRKPCIGIPAKDYQLLLGRTLASSVKEGCFILPNDLYEQL